MKQFILESLHKDNTVWEKFIEPEYPEQPLIRICKNTETACYEAVFALELAGIIRKNANH